MKTFTESKMKNQRPNKSQLKEELVLSEDELKKKIGFITFCTFNYGTGKEIRRNRRRWREVHDKKLKNLLDKKGNESNGKRKTPRNIVHNFSSYTLTPEETHILEYGLDHHIHTRMDTNNIKTEFEAMYYHLDKHFKDLPSDEKDEMKSKIRRTCENYINLPSKSKYEETINRLSKNKDIVILRQDKGKGVILMNRSKYVEKCLSQLETPNFNKIDADPTKSFETKVQTALHNIKVAIREDQYRKI